MAHCEKHNILVDYQHGFRKSRSCETQLITVREEIAKWKDDGHNVDMFTNTNTKIFIKSSQMDFSDSIYNNIKGSPNYLQDHSKTTLKLNMSII